MKNETINITEDGRVNLTCYYREEKEGLPNANKTPAILIFPGGGYNHLSEREADPIAFEFFAKGYSCFILRYSINQYAKFPDPLIEALKAIAIIRRNGDKFNIDPEKIAVIGFSAGGHLAGTLATLWHEEEYQLQANVTYDEVRPNAIILGYAVTSTDWVRRALPDLKLNPFQIDFTNDDEVKLMEPYRNVSKNTPPTFLMHTTEDSTVPSMDSLKFALALEENSIPYEMHIFQKGGHGLSLGNILTDNGTKNCINYNFSKWIELCLNWLKEIL